MRYGRYDIQICVTRKHTASVFKNTDHLYEEKKVEDQRKKCENYYQKITHSHNYILAPKNRQHLKKFSI